MGERLAGGTVAIALLGARSQPAGDRRRSRYRGTYDGLSRRNRVQSVRVVGRGESRLMRFACYGAVLCCFVGVLWTTPAIGEALRSQLTVSPARSLAEMEAAGIRMAFDVASVKPS